MNKKDVRVAEAEKEEEIHTEFDNNTELDRIFTKLHEADDRIAKDREKTLRLGKETRAMLTDLRKQLG